MLFRFPESKVTPELFEYEQTRFLDYAVEYLLHSDFRTAVRLSSWVKSQVDNASNELVELSKKIPDRAKPDEQILEVLTFVTSYLTYTPDSKVWRMSEYWQTAEESMKLKTGDCEDGAILAYVLARLKGIPANRMGICAGDVSGGGHCWLAYKPQCYPLDWVFMDWCYWTNLNPISMRPKFHINGQKIECYDASDNLINGNYYDIWFIFNESWSSRSIDYQLK